MSIVLKTPSNGSVTLAEQDTASDVVVTVPAVTSTLLNNSSGVMDIGSGQVYKAANGNVGIGTTAPTSVSGYTSLSIRSTSGAELQLSNTAVSAQATLWCDANGLTFNNHAATNQIWNIAGGEKMRLNSSGNLMLGTTTSFGKFVVDGGATSPMSLRFSGAGGAAVGLNFIYDNSAGSAYAATFYYNGTSSLVGTIIYTSSGTSYNTTSDYRLKENVAPMTGALAKVAALNPCTYTWKADGSAGQGFIAHELQAVVPDCVTGEKDAMRTEQYEVSPAIPATFDEDGNEITPAIPEVMGERKVPQYQGIDVSFLVATLTAAIQEQQALITQLQADVAALQGAA